MFQQTFCSSEVGTLQHLSLFGTRLTCLSVTANLPLRFGLSLLGPSTSNSFLGASLAPPSLLGCQAIGQSAQKSEIAAVSLEKGIRAGFPLGPHACGLVLGLGQFPSPCRAGLT